MVLFKDGIRLPVGRLQNEIRVYYKMPTLNGQAQENESSKETKKEFSGRRE